MNKIHVASGVVDADYEGTLKVILYNLSDKIVHIKSNESTAQILFVKLWEPFRIHSFHRDKVFPEVDMSSGEQDVGTSVLHTGFGSTGKCPKLIAKPNGGGHSGFEAHTGLSMLVPLESAPDLHSPSTG